MAQEFFTQLSFCTAPQSLGDRDGRELRPREPVHEQVTVTGHDI